MPDTVPPRNYGRDGPDQAHLDPGGTGYLLPTDTVSTILGYAILEMLTRKLLVVTANDRDQGPSDLVSLLGRFEKQTTHLGLTGDLSNLTKRMLSHEPGVVLNLNQRLKKGRNELMHGNVLRMMESEGHLLVLLVDLLVLHAMKEELEAPRADA